MKRKNHKDLIVWQKSMLLARSIHVATRSFRETFWNHAPAASGGPHSEQHRGRVPRERVHAEIETGIALAKSEGDIHKAPSSSHRSMSSANASIP